MMKKFFRNTPGGKAGSIDGLNLFFGALLGANLGTMQSLPLYQYVQIILVLAGAVMVLRMISTSEQRGRVLALLAFYVVLVSGMVFIPALKPKGLPDADLQLIATLAIWITCVLMVEFSPVREDGYI
jgi:drug/metabolite transporter (DMT)-like permease